MAKTKKVKELEFPATLFVVAETEFGGGTYLLAKPETGINDTLEMGKRTKVGIYELVGYEYRTMKQVVDIEEA